MMTEPKALQDLPLLVGGGEMYHVKTKPFRSSKVKIPGISIVGNIINPHHSTPPKLSWQTITDDSQHETVLQVVVPNLDNALEESREERVYNFPTGEVIEHTFWSTVTGRSLQEADLKEALSDLDSAVDEAREEEFDTLPSEEVINNARRILQQMFKLHRCRYEVYPTQDGEITISAFAEHQRSVLVICDKEGGALCSVNLNGLHRRARYDSAATLPDGFVKEALAELI